MRSRSRHTRPEAGLKNYEIHEWIGGGGTAQVWRATHRATGQMVAIKTLKHTSRHAESLRELFHREAQLIAGLDHTNVVDIIDFGIQPSELVMPRRETLPAGTPYMAMEYLPGGSIHRLQGRLSWKQVSEVAFQLLDGLAHAHARGIVHLDLKPANILLQQPLSGRNKEQIPRVKIADFGISTWIGKATSRRGLGGTPTYAAPEQIRGAWRDVGPWTDFYSLSCTLWALLTGSTPYRPRTWQEAMQEHLHSNPPPFKPRTAVPEGLEDLLLLLLEKQPQQRLQRAAAIAQRIHGFNESPPSLDLPEPFSMEPEAEPAPSNELSELPTQLFSMVDQNETLSDRSLESTPSLASESLRSQENWQRVRPAALPQQSPHSGLALCRYKVPKFVGRQALRDQLWERLIAVREQAHPHTIVLQGQRGVGMSRILKWLGERSHELGMAHVLLVQLQEHRSAVDSIAHSLRKWMRLQGLSARVCASRIRSELLACGVDDPRLEKRLNAVLCEDLQTPVQSVSLRIIERFLIAKSRDSAMILLLDDAQHFDGLKDFLEILIQQRLPQDTGGLLTVAGIQHTGASAPSLGLIDHPASLEIQEVPPLSKTEHLALIRQIVPLEPELANELALQTYRNPSLAITQLIEWVESGLLVSSPIGYQFSQSTSLSFGDEKDFWQQRLAPFLPIIESLEIAAAWGNRWTQDLWQEHSGTPDLRAQADAFQKAGLIHWHDGAWSFTSKQLQVYLEEHARTRGRWRSHHERCLQIIQKRPELAWRMGRHLSGSGQNNQALKTLMEEAETCINNHAFHEAASALNTCKTTLTALKITESDRRGAEVLLLEARLAAFSGNPTLAVSKAENLLALAMQNQWSDLEPHALRIKGRCMLESPNSNQAMQYLQQAYDGAVRQRDEELANWILIDQVRLLSYRRADENTLPLARRALKNATALGHLQMQINANWRSLMHSIAQESSRRALKSPWGLTGDSISVPTHLEISTKARLASTLMALKQETELVATLYTELAQIYEENGHLPRQIDALHNLGSIHRWENDLDAAERCYRKALVLSQGASETSQAFSNLNVGLLLILKGQILAAADFTAPVLTTALKLNNPLLEAAARAVSLCVDCETRNWESVNLELVRLSALLSKMRVVPHDLTLLLNVASDLLKTQEQTALRQQLAQLARSHTLVA